MKRAVILAGGRGSRLSPHTDQTPKPLVKLGEIPILEIIIRQLQRFGITDITLAVGYLAERIEAYFHDGHAFGVSLGYSVESEPLGTAGPLSLIDYPDHRFLVVNSDVLTNLDISLMLAEHLARGAVCTLASRVHEIAVPFGVVEFSPAQELIRYEEKPVYQCHVSLGIYIFEPRVLYYLKKGEHLDQPELMNRLTAAGETVNCFNFNGYWQDIGNPANHAVCEADVEKLGLQWFLRNAD